MHSPEGSILLVSADSRQRLLRNSMYRPQVGALSEVLLISDKDIPETACAVQKTASFRCLPLSGKDLTMCTVLDATIASDMTMYACHPVTFWSSNRLLQALYDVS